MSGSPRIAVYYDVLPSTGMRNDGAPFYLTYNLRKMLGKDNVIHLSPGGDLSHCGTFDLHILPDYGEDALGISLDWEIPHPNFYWCSDAHITESGYKYRLDRARKFDGVGCCQKRAMEEFIRDGVPAEKIIWLPHAFEPDCYKPMAVIEKYDWAFVGYLNSENRVNLLDALLKAFPKAYLGWRLPQFKGHNVFEDACKKYCQAKVVPNYTISDDLPMRVFEVMGSKCCLLTNDIPTAHELFRHGRHLFYFKSVPEAVDLMGSLLKDDSARNMVAEEGYQEVVDKHTYRHRAEQILKTALDFQCQGEVPVHAH